MRGHDGGEGGQVERRDKEIVVIVEGVARVAEAAQPVDEPPGVDLGIAILHGMVMELDEDLAERGEFVSTDSLQEFILGAFDIQLQHVGRVQPEVVEQGDRGEGPHFVAGHFIANGIDVVREDGTKVSVGRSLASKVMG